MVREALATPPVIVLGGSANALSIARSLGRRGVVVYAINESQAPVRYSRYCRWLPVPWRGGYEESWAAYLLGPEAEPLRGAIVLAASDEGLEVLAHNRERLRERFLLDESNPAAQRAMLNKLDTYRIAREAGVPTPRFWVLDGRQSLAEVGPELVFPLLVKPLSSHRFAGRFGGRKFFVAGDRKELEAAVADVGEAGLEVMLVEQVPGPDDRLCSYYTYLDGEGEALFDFTKRIVRRFPVGMGNGCYHVTDRVPGVRELSLRLFRAAGLRGLANAEFKRDDRDGQLKLIECNARFTAANCLVAQSGFDLAAFVYNRLTGRPQPPLEEFRTGLHLWYPTQDWKAFRELRRQGELSLGGWLRSVARRQTFPYFSWRDPAPSIVGLLRHLKVDVAWGRTRRLLRGAAARCRGWFRALAGQPS
jgi:predicted ATP-grasp superfamily ATP-dependent carboligase